MPVLKYYGDDRKVHIVGTGGTGESEVVDSSDGNFTDKAISQRAAKAYTDSKQDLRSASGQIIQVETTAAGVPALAIAGKTYQEGTPSPDAPAMICGAGESLNLLNVRDQITSALEITVTVRDGVIKMTRASAGSAGNIKIGDIHLTAGKYTYSHTNSDVNTSFFLANSDNTIHIESDMTYTLDKDVDLIIYVYANPNFSGKAVINPMLVRGSAPKPWQPFGHHLKISRTGKNLFDGKLKSGHYGIADGIFWASSSYAVIAAPIPVSSETKVSAVLSYSYRSCYWVWFDADGQYLGYTSGTVQKNPYPDKARFAYFEFSSKDGRDFDLSEITDLQIEYGSSASAYESYQGQDINYPLSDPLYDGDWIEPNGKIVRKKKKLILDGTESWSAPGSPYPTLTHITFYERDALAVCSHFVHRLSGSEGIELAQGFNMYSSYKVLYVNFLGIANTVEEFKTWLASQYAAGTPVTIVYELAEPEIEYTAPDQPLELLSDSNVVQDDGVYPADLTLYYSRCGMPVFQQKCESNWITLWTNPNQPIERIEYKIKNDVVYFNVYEYPISDGPLEWHVLPFVLSEEIRPHWNVRGTASTYSNSTFLGQFVIGVDGTVRICSPEVPISLYFFATWPLER